MTDDNLDPGTICPILIHVLLNVQDQGQPVVWARDAGIADEYNTREFMCGKSTVMQRVENAVGKGCR